MQEKFPVLKKCKKDFNVGNISRIKKCKVNLLPTK